MSGAENLGSSLAHSQNKQEAFQVMMLSEDIPLVQNVAFTGVSAYSQALQAKTSIIKVLPTQDCYVRLVRSDASAVVAAPAQDGAKVVGHFLAGGITEFLGIPLVQGVTWKLAIVRKSTSGEIDITEGA